MPTGRNSPTSTLCTPLHACLLCLQMRPLLRKLNAGQPIIVAAFGTSITGGYGGCFQQEDQQAHETYLRSLGVKEVYHSAGLGSLKECTVFPVSWLTTFMKQINTTWPHPGHALVNLGGSGVCSMPSLAQQEQQGLVLVRGRVRVAGPRGEVPTCTSNHMANCL